MRLKRNHVRAAALVAGVAAVSLLAAGCSSSAAGGSSQTKGVTITVALFGAPPPKASLAAFTKSTGITVKWSTIDWDSLQTKIAAASTSNTYFADATDVDWSRVGQEGKLGWFVPMEKYIDTKALAADMPQLSSFTYQGKVVGIPFDSSYLVTTVNKTQFAKAGITPRTSRSSRRRTPPATRRRSGWSTRSSPGWCPPETSTSPTARASRR
jgi:multiple sugar transport system substrate-binding protein